MSSFLEETNITERVFTRIREERRRQDSLWGVQMHSVILWLPILTEEVGEVAEAINEWYHGGGPFEDIQKELVEVAAVAVAALERIERYQEPPKP